MLIVDLLKICMGDVDDVERKFMTKIVNDSDVADSDKNDVIDKTSNVLESNSNTIIDESSNTKNLIEKSFTNDLENTNDKANQKENILSLANLLSIPTLSGSGGSEVVKGSLKPFNATEGFVLKKKKPKTKLASTENAKDAHYSAIQNYPNSESKIDALGNFIKINKKTGQVDIAHFSGTLIQITKSGSVNIHTKKDFQHIVDGNYYLEVKGDLGIKSKNINIETENYKKKTKTIDIKSNDITITSNTKTNKVNDYTLISGTSKVKINSSEVNLNSGKIKTKSPQLHHSGTMYLTKSISYDGGGDRS